MSSASSSLELLRRNLAEDRNWRRYSELCRQIQQSYPVKEVEEEILHLHAARTSRKPRQDTTAAILLKIAANEIRTRARLSEILVESMKPRRALEALIDLLETYLPTEYSRNFIGLKTKGDRDAIVDALLADGRRIVSRMERVESQVSVVIQDIDKSGYNLRLMGDMLELVARRESIAGITI